MAIKKFLIFFILAVMTFLVVDLPRKMNLLYDCDDIEYRKQDYLTDFELKSRDIATYYINNFAHINASKAYEQQSFFEGAKKKFEMVIKEVFLDEFSHFNQKNAGANVSYYLTTNVLAVINNRPVVLRFSEICVIIDNVTFCVEFEEKTNTMLKFFYYTETKHDSPEKIKKNNSKIISCVDEYFKNRLYLRDDDLYYGEGAYEASKNTNGEIIWSGYAEAGIAIQGDNFVKEESIVD
ncbi:MAG: hypothetical protein E7613_08980 [Ruminococcaceae bacterium]|nr:hypothetical protein [Oscillospiraceae bacterium]